MKTLFFMTVISSISLAQPRQNETPILAVKLSKTPIPPIGIGWLDIRVLNQDKEYRNRVIKHTMESSEQFWNTFAGISADAQARYNMRHFNYQMHRNLVETVTDGGMKGTTKKFPGTAYLTGPIQKLRSNYYDKELQEIRNAQIYETVVPLKTFLKENRIDVDFRINKEATKQWFAANGDKVLGGSKGYQEMLNSVHEVEKPLLRDHIIESLINYTGQHGVDIENLKTDMKLTKEEVAQLSISHEKLQNQVNAMAATQEVIIDNYKILSNRVDVQESKTAKNSLEINQLKEFIYSKEPASVQLGLLKKKVIGQDMTPENRKVMEDTLKLRQTLEEDIPKLGGFLSAYAGFAASLGASPELTKALAMTANIANKAPDIVSKYLSGDVLGAASGVMSLFSGGGPSQEEVFFGAIMAKLDAIIETQKVIIENQRRMAEVLEVINAKADQILKQLDRVEGRLDTNIGLSNELLRKASGLSACKEMADFYPGNFANYQERQNWASKYLVKFNLIGSATRDILIECTSGLKDLFSNTDPTNPQSASKLFSVDSYSNKGTSHFTVLETYKNTFELYRALLPYTLEIDKNLNPEHLAFRILKEDIPAPISSMKLRLLRTRAMYERIASNPEKAKANGFFGNQIPFLYSVDAINTYVDYLLKFNFYPHFLKANSASGWSLMNPKDIANMTAMEGAQMSRNLTQSLTQLETALRIVNTALVQQQLLSGDVILHGVAQLLGFSEEKAAFVQKLESSNEGKLTLTALSEKAQKALAQNHYLKINFGRYIMLNYLRNQRLNGMKRPFFRYDFARLTGDRYYVEDIIKKLPSGTILADGAPSQQRFVLKMKLSENVAKDLGYSETEILLPTAYELAGLSQKRNRQVESVMTTELEILMDLRERLLNEIVGYKGFENMPESQKLSLVEAQLLN